MLGVLKQINQAHGYYSGGSQSQNSYMGGGNGGFGDGSVAYYPRTGRPLQRNNGGELARMNTFTRDWYAKGKRLSSVGNGAGYSNNRDGDNAYKYQNTNSPTFCNNWYYVTNHGCIGNGAKYNPSDAYTVDGGGDIDEEGGD